MSQSQTQQAPEPKVGDEMIAWVETDRGMRKLLGKIQEVQYTTFTRPRYWIEFNLTDPYGRPSRIWLDYNYRDGEWRRYPQ